MLKTILAGVLLSGVAVIAPASATGLIGASPEAVQALMPAGARPAVAAADGARIEYRDITIGDTRWSRVVMNFDPAHHLSSMSFRSTTMDFDTLKRRAQAQYDAYITEQMTVSDTSGAAVEPMQVRVCQQPGAGVVMTLERPSSAL